MELTFLGATGTVTGSKYLLRNNKKNYLIDCGLFQGFKKLRLRNWEKPPFHPEKIDALLLTHAHIDHSGYIPRLVKAGFRGPIFCSQGTFDLCKILLPDSGHIQEVDAQRVNRYGYSQHTPALPLYTAEEARYALAFFEPLAFDQLHILDDALSFTLHRAGHIIGASFVRVAHNNGTSILFSGDIGRFEDPIMKPPVNMSGANYVVVESTYGDRLHGASNTIDALGSLIKKTAARGGSIVIPAFAVGRAQTILYYVYQLKKQKKIPTSLPVFLDSPMAISASELLFTHIQDHKLTQHLCAEVAQVAHYTRTVDESKAINSTNAIPKIIISASGMATGGRILHHFKYYLGDPRNTIILSGFQAAGTRGDRLARGETELKIFNKMYPVRAEIVQFDTMSAHADYADILKWLSHFTCKPEKVFVVHGEHSAAQSLQSKIKTQLGWKAVVPDYQQRENLI